MTRTLLVRTALAVAGGMTLVGLAAGCDSAGSAAGDRPPGGSSASHSDATAAATGTGSATATPADAVVINVTLANGTVDPNGKKINVSVGQTVLINATSDHDDEVHVHSNPGLQLAVSAGETVHGSFVAQESGSFEVESHHPHKILAILNVR